MAVLTPCCCSEWSRKFCDAVDVARRLVESCKGRCRHFLCAFAFVQSLSPWRSLKVLIFSSEVILLRIFLRLSCNLWLDEVIMLPQTAVYECGSFFSLQSWFLFASHHPVWSSSRGLSETSEFFKNGKQFSTPLPIATAFTLPLNPFISWVCASPWVLVFMHVLNGCLLLRICFRDHRYAEVSV